MPDLNDRALGTCAICGGGFNLQIDLDQYRICHDHKFIWLIAKGVFTAPDPDQPDREAIKAIFKGFTPLVDVSPCAVCSRMTSNPLGEAAVYCSTRCSDWATR